VLLGWATQVSVPLGDNASLVLVTKTAPESIPAALKPFFGGRYRTKTGRRVGRSRVPGRPPKAGRAPVPLASPTRLSTTIPGVSAFIWTHGCSPTVAGMLCGLLDRNGCANLYTGPVNGGACPLSRSVAPTE